MPKASEVATELRKLADSLEREPDAQIPKPFLFFSTFLESNEKQMFSTVCGLMPRPLAKEYRDSELKVEYNGAALTAQTSIQRSKVCRLVEPAKPAVYECEPILAEAEEAQIGAAL